MKNTMIYINSAVAQINQQVEDTIYFENGYRIEFDYYKDCCASIYLDNLENAFKVGTHIGYLNLVSDGGETSLFLKGLDDDFNEIFCEAFYNSNSGWYSPYTNMTIYDNNNKIIFQDRLDDDNVEGDY